MGNDVEPMLPQKMESDTVKSSHWRFPVGLVAVAALPRECEMVHLSDRLLQCAGFRRSPPENLVPDLPAAS